MLNMVSENLNWNLVAGWLNGKIFKSTDPFLYNLGKSGLRVLKVIKH